MPGYLETQRKRAPARGDRHFGFTLIELLVVLLIIGLLMALLLPAVQSAREFARRMECQNSLRQVGIAVTLFEGARRVLPAATYGTPYNEAGPRGSPFTKLLPYLEQQAVADQYDWRQDWYAPENQPAINGSIRTYRCPSAQGPSLQRGLGNSPSILDAPNATAAVTDFAAVYSWGAPFAVPNTPFTRDPWAVGSLSPTPEDAAGFLTGSTKFERPLKSNTTDGASYTLTFVERAAATQRWIKNRMVDASPATAKAWAPWAGQGCTWLLSYVEDGSTWAPTGLGPCNVNCSNHQGVYAFHRRGANVVCLDGAVHFLGQEIDGKALYALVSRSRGDAAELPP